MDLSQLTLIEQRLCTRLAQKQKLEGNYSMSTKRYARAIRQYTRAIKLFPYVDSSFYTNRALACLKLEGGYYCYRDALEDLCVAESIIDACTSDVGGACIIADNDSKEGGCGSLRTNNVGSKGKAREMIALDKKIKLYMIRVQLLMEMSRYGDVVDVANHMLNVLRQKLKVNNNNDNNNNNGGVGVGVGGDSECRQRKQKLSKSVQTFTQIKLLAQDRLCEFNQFTMNGQKRINFVDEFSTCQELIECIFSYLAPEDMLRCSAVCFGWRAIALDKHFWMPFCQRRWHGKQTVGFSTVLRRSLEVERQRQQELQKQRERQAREMQEDEASQSSNESIVEPFDWRRAYYEAEHEAQRVKTTAQELSTRTFIMQMHHSTNEQPISCRFLPNYTFAFPGMVLEWRFVDLDRKIQFGEYPPMKISRDKDTWAWVFTNEYAWITSV